jgi:pimeloyl-ACP methyl ester carboxylesterase
MSYRTTSSTIDVSGAKIYYETRGSGPTLLIIPGGPQDAGVFAAFAQQLANRYTVVAYDPRGNSRSSFDGEPEELQIDVQGDDAARLLETLSSQPAYVFGTSGGAQIGLNLAARYPTLVRTLVAHEPPCVLMLPDPAAALAADQEIYETYRQEGVEAAMAKFFATNNLEEGAEQGDAPPEFDQTPKAAETFTRVRGNFEYWLSHGLMPLSLYRPDVKVLRIGKPQVVVGLGEQSAGQVIYSIGMAFAKKLNTEPIIFPGDHFGFEHHAQTFAEILHHCFTAS